MATQPTNNQTASASKFTIPDYVKDMYPHLIPLILETESMADEERQYWFSILPVMTEEQVKKLEQILLNEKAQLKKIDDQYSKELKQINDKHMVAWKDFEIREKRQKLQKTETTEEATEAVEEAELLKKLQNL